MRRITEHNLTGSVRRTAPINRQVYTFQIQNFLLRRRSGVQVGLLVRIGKQARIVYLLIILQVYKAVSRGVFWVLKTPRNYLQFLS